MRRLDHLGVVVDGSGQQRTQPRAVGRVFYVWLSVFNLFVVSVFWSLCADVARPEQGRRLFGPIAAGGTAGALVGPMLTRTLVEHIDIAALILIAVALLEGAVWCAFALDRAARRMPAAETPATAAAPVGGDGLVSRLVDRATGINPVARAIVF